MESFIATAENSHDHMVPERAAPSLDGGCAGRLLGSFSSKMAADEVSAKMTTSFRTLSPRKDPIVMNPDVSQLPPLENDLKRVFGSNATIAPLTSTERLGRRVAGIDLTEPLTPSQAALLVALVDWHRIVLFPTQDTHGFSVGHLEQVANHFGAPLPHPHNYANYVGHAAGDLLELHPIEERTSTLVDQAFPGSIMSLDGADSPAVYIVTNLVGSGPTVEPEVRGGQHWHTDIEFEPAPLSTSLFYVQRTPTTRNSSRGTWVDNPPREPGFYHPDSSATLSELREALPLNAETAYADTAAAFAALPEQERRMLEKVMVRRRLRVTDGGWMVPLVYTNPRSGVRSLHSPVWASRGRRVAPVEVDGMGSDESRRFLDRLEEHCLQPEFRYDHVHTPGDVTIWNNFATLHTAPPSKPIVNHPDDARLLYRISCKGDPSYELPRSDTDKWIAANISPPYRTPPQIPRVKHNGG